MYPVSVMTIIIISLSMRLSSIIFVISLLAATIFFIQRIKLSKQKRILAEQKQKIVEEEIKGLLQTQQIEFMRAQSEGEEIGRHRIARQIHDGVGGLLVSAKWNLESALEELPKKESKVISRLNENLRLQEMSYKELRRVVYELEREDVPWWEDLQKFYQRVSEQTQTKIQFYNYNLDRRLGGTFGEECRYIVQEVITNAIKHAKPTEITVYINLIDDVLGIIVEDDGAGGGRIVGACGRGPVGRFEEYLRAARRPARAPWAHRSRQPAPGRPPRPEAGGGAAARPGQPWG